MNNVIPFVPRKNLAARVALQDFVDWARSQAHHYDKPDDPMQWSAESWHRWGLKASVFTKLGGGELLDSEFIDFAKAVIFEERVVKLKDDHIILQALRVLEAALLEFNKSGCVSNVNPSVLDKACLIAQDYHEYEFSSYRVSRQLKILSNFLNYSGMVVDPFVWDPQIKIPRVTLKDCEKDSQEKMPSKDSLSALGEIFYSQPHLPLDIMVTSAAAIMLSQPCRVGELKYLKKDCLYTEENSEGEEQLYILWFSEKGYGVNRKPVIDSMSSVCREAIERVVKITEEPREYAKWLEENPDKFPMHFGVPSKGIDEPLSHEEACSALMLSTANHSPKYALKRFLEKVKKRKTISGKARKIAGEILEEFEISESLKNDFSESLVEPDVERRQKLNLRNLNLLVREKYLPEGFPYVDNKKITKWKDALFCFRSGTFRLAENAVRKPFGLTGCDSGRLSAQLSKNQEKTKSIFERYGYAGVKVNTHAFRHYLNTGAHRANLAQELIARWSGRVDVRQNRVYNHMSVDEKTEELNSFLAEPPAAAGNLISAIKSNSPIKMEDIGEKGDRIVHRTEFGVCIHDYAQEPCAKFNNCLTCGEHICVKGDDTKLENLKEEREYLRGSLETFRKEANEGTYGSNTWLNTTMEKLERCTQLIKILESPEIEIGALIRGEENGWTSGRNALAMREELFEENNALIETDIQEDKVSELERLLGFGG